LLTDSAAAAAAAGTTVSAVLPTSKQMITTASTNDTTSPGVGLCTTYVCYKCNKKLSYRRRTALYVSKFVLRLTSYGSYKGFTQQKRPSESFKGLGNGAI